MGCRSNWYANDEIRKISLVTRFPFSDFTVPCKREGSGTLSTEPLYSLHLVSRDILLGPKSFYTTVFPVCSYGFTPMPDWRRRLIVSRVRLSEEQFAKGSIVTSTRTARSYGMMSAGILSAGTAIISSRLDEFMFYSLASGSILLTIAFSFRSLEYLMRGFGRRSEVADAPTGFRNAL
jgi:hypothetical protein